MEALEAILEEARSAPLSEMQIEQLQGVLHTLGRLTQELEKKRTSIHRLRSLLFGPNSEKTEAVLKQKKSQENDTSKTATRGQEKQKKPKGHGRNGADAYQGAKRIQVSHGSLKSGDPCPETGCTGKVYRLSEPGVVVRIQGLPPLPATLYELEKLRCNLCGKVFTANPPEGTGEEKYDETAVSMIGCLKYGAGFPFHRLEKLEKNLGIPLPAATQWDLVKEASERIKPVYHAIIDEAAQGEVLHNDDTPMKILELMAENQTPAYRNNASKRTGLFTSGIISKREDHLMALFSLGVNTPARTFKRCWKKDPGNSPHRSRQLSQPRTPPLRRCGGELSRGSPLRVGDPGQGLQERCRGTAGEAVAPGSFDLSSAGKQTPDGGDARVVLAMFANCERNAKAKKLSRVRFSQPLGSVMT